MNNLDLFVSLRKNVKFGHIEFECNKRNFKDKKTIDSLKLS